MPKVEHAGRGKADAKAASPQTAEPDNARVLQKRQLVARIAQRVGQRSTEVRAVVDATLAELGEAIAAGHTLALPPLGRARISLQKDVSGTEVIVIRLRRRNLGPASEAGQND